MEQDHPSTQQELGPEGAAESEHSLHATWKLQDCPTQHREDIPSDQLRGGRPTPAQTGGTQHCLGKGWDHSPTPTAQGRDVSTESCYSKKQGSNYICQPHRSPQTQLGRSMKWDLFKNEKAGNKLHLFSGENNAGINSFSGKQKEVT